MNITKKSLSLVTVERNSVDKIDTRAIHSVTLSKFAYENLIFFDESGFNQHTRRSYGHSREYKSLY